MKLDNTANGVYSIAPTPFLDDGSIDWNSVDRMTDFYFDAGCDGFTILGVLGEASKMDAEEALALAARVIKRAGGKPIIVGVSAPGFAAMRSLSRKVMDMVLLGEVQYDQNSPAVAAAAAVPTDDDAADPDDREDVTPPPTQEQEPEQGHGPVQPPQ